MQFPIPIGLHRSFLFLPLLLSSHGLTAVVMLTTPWPVWARLSLLGVLGISLVAAWRQWQPKIADLRLFSDGRLECRLSGEEHFVIAQLLPDATVHPLITAFRIRVEGSTFSMVVLPGNATMENFRYLRIWLKWRAAFIPDKDAV